MLHTIFLLCGIGFFCDTQLNAQGCQADFNLMSDSSLVAIFVNTSLSDSNAGFIWSFGDNTVDSSANPTHTYLSDGEYTVCLSIVDSANQCFDTFCDTIVACDTCVWPGDANADGIANNHDFLWLGLGYFMQGFSRIDNNIGWYKHSTNSWSQSFSNGANFKNADCDGSGFISGQDTNAIVTNYGKMHAKGSGDPCTDSSDVPLFPIFSQDTVQAGDTVFVDFHLGNNAIPASDYYGLAFTLNYERLLVDSGSLIVSFGNTVFGTQDTLLTFYRDFHDNGETDIAITRIDGNSRSGSGIVCSASFVMEDNLVQKGPGDDIITTFLTFSFNDVLLLSNDESEIPVCAKEDSIFAFQLIGGVRIPENEKLKIYPNPAREVLNIELKNQRISKVEMFDVLGKKVLESSFGGTSKVQIDVQHLTKALYFLQVHSDYLILKSKIAVSLN